MEVQDQDADRVGFLVRVLFLACRRLPSCSVLSWQRKEALVSLPLLIRALLLSWGPYPYDLV